MIVKHIWSSHRFSSHQNYNSRINKHRICAVGSKEPLCWQVERNSQGIARLLNIVNRLVRILVHRVFQRLAVLVNIILNMTDFCTLHNVVHIHIGIIDNYRQECNPTFVARNHNLKFGCTESLALLLSISHYVCAIGHLNGLAYTNRLCPVGNCTAIVNKEASLNTATKLYHFVVDATIEILVRQCTEIILLCICGSPLLSCQSIALPVDKTEAVVFAKHKVLTLVVHHNAIGWRI